MALLLLLTISAPAFAGPVRVDAVTADLIAEADEVAPGQTVTVGLHLVHDDGWHTYWRNPGDSGLPTQFSLATPDGAGIGDIQWPIPSRMLIPPLANLGFEGEALLMREVTVPADFAGETFEMSTTAQWLVCREVCIPGEADLSLRLKVGANAGPGPQAELFRLARKHLPSGRISAPALLDDQSLTWLLPADLDADSGDSVRLEYFPYHEALVRYAAPQQLARQPASGEWLLKVELEPPVPGLPHEPPTLEKAEGLIVINGRRAVEVSAKRTPAQAFALPAGPYRSIEGHIVPIFAQMNAAENLRKAAGSGSLASDLLAGAGARSGASSSPVTSLAGAGVPAQAPAADGSAAMQSVWIAIVFAMIGGLILNLMPCVFPVIGLKILGFAGSGAGGEGLTDQARKNVRNGSLWFAAGVIITFAALGGLLLLLRATGESIGWGFQLQSPLFVVAMALLFVAIGLNFSGVYEIGVSMTQLGNLQQPANPHSRHSAAGALGSGVLAVLVATPCTAPFMGSALGFTLAEPAAVTMVIFIALGIGMALPYFILGLAPGWLRWMPRPGRWMETLRQFLAFPMYAAAAWLTWVLGLQAGVDAVLALALGAVVLAFALWVFGRQFQNNRGAGRGVYLLASIALLAAALVLAWPGVSSESRAASRSTSSPVAGKLWQPWQADEVSRLLADGTPVFIDFTAAWCISCQVNKRLVLETEDVRDAFVNARVVTMRADWTQQDPAITAELARHGRNSVPLYLLFKPGAPVPVVLPELLTKSLVLDALKF